MAWLGDREFWVNLIGFASIASAAIFGLLALFTDYKKDGKVTRWGRLYAGGIALSAVLAMTSAVLQRRIAADEAAAGEQAARDQRARQQAQFDTQLGHLQRLNGQMEQVNEDNSTILDRMAASLRSQASLLTSAQRGMLLTSRLGVQERENTGRVLRGLWDETNRISANSFVVDVTIFCGGNLSTSVSALFTPAAGGSAELVLMRLGDVPQLTIAPVPGELDPAADTTLFFMHTSRGVALTSLHQQTIAHRVRSQLADGTMQTIRFTTFTGGDLGALANPEAWNDLHVGLRLTGWQGGLAERFRAFAISPMLDRSALEERGYRFPDLGDQARITLLPCQMVAATVTVNDRIAAEMEGAVFQIQENPRDDRGLVVGWFPFTQVEGNVFPRYGQRPQAAATAQARP